MQPSATKNIFLITFISNLLLVGIVTPSFSVASEISKTNGSIILPSERTDDSDLRTVNGRIEVGEGITVGNVKTVNGRISLGPEATAKDVKTTNGRIYIEKGTTTGSLRTTNGRIYIDAGLVNGDVRTTNGNIEIDDGSKVEGNVITANGGIDLRDTSVAKDIEITNGNIRLNSSQIGGDIVINKQRGWSLFHFGHWDKPDVVIGPNSVVKGSIIARQDINLYIHESASVGGIEGAEAEYYSGNRP